MTTAWRSRITGSGDEDPTQLLANPRNWRTHPATQRMALRGSLDTVGWVQQVMVNTTTGHVVDGHARVEEAISKGEPTVPVLYVELSPEEEALVLATLDPIGAMAERDDERLRSLLAEITVDDAGLLALLGDLAGNDPKAGLTDPDEVPEPPEEPYVKPGELYRLGDHRLLCGDSTSSADMARLMGSTKAQLAFTSPPYNVGMDYRSYDDDVSKEQYWRLIDGVLGLVVEALDDGGALMWNVGVSPKVRPFDHCVAIERAGLTWLRQIVWRKSGVPIPIWQHTVSRSRARHYTPNYCHEVLFLASKGHIQDGGTIDPDSAFQHDVWDVPTGGPGGNGHPAPFPSRLAVGVIRHLSSADEFVLDPFSGSGTTIIAAQQLGRRCYAMEIDPRYVQVAIERWQNFTGKTAVRVDD